MCVETSCRNDLSSVRSAMCVERSCRNDLSSVRSAMCVETSCRNDLSSVRSAMCVETSSRNDLSSVRSARLRLFRTLILVSSRVSHAAPNAAFVKWGLRNRVRARLSPRHLPFAIRPARPSSALDEYSKITYSSYMITAVSTALLPPNQNARPYLDWKTAMASDMPLFPNQPHLPAPSRAFPRFIYSFAVRTAPRLIALNRSQ